MTQGWQQQIADAGGIVNVQDVAVLTGVNTLTTLTSPANNFNLDDAIGSAGNDSLVGTNNAETLTGGHGVDVIDGLQGTDTVNITETYQTADTVIIRDETDITSITGFTTQVADDVIRIDVSDMNTALTGGGQLVDLSADLDAANDNVVFQTLTDGATLATGAVDNAANGFKFTDTTGLNSIADLTYNITLDANRGDADDKVLGLFYDANDGLATLITMGDTGGADAKSMDTSGSEVVLATAAMSTAEYTAP